MDVHGHLLCRRTVALPMSSQCGSGPGAEHLLTCLFAVSDIYSFEPNNFCYVQEALERLGNEASLALYTFSIIRFVAICG